MPEGAICGARGIGSQRAPTFLSPTSGCAGRESLAFVVPDIPEPASAPLRALLLMTHLVGEVAKGC